MREKINKVKAKATLGVLSTTSANVIDNTTGNSTTDAPSVNAVKMQHTNENWIAPTLINSWVNYCDGFSPIGYYKHDGRVYLRGLAKGGTIGYTMFILPEGYRPAGVEIFGTAVTAAFGAVYITSDGSVRPEAGANGWVSLSGISFRVD